MHLNKLRFAALTSLGLAAGVVVVAACSSDDSTTPATTTKTPDAATTADTGTTTTPPVSDAGTDDTATACATLANARCAKFDSCANGIGTQTRYGDAATCISRLTAQCVAGLAAANTGASAASTTACATAITAEPCETFFGVLDAPEACAPVPGTLANGVACALSAQCQSAFCNVGANAACGVCATPAATGAACGPSLGCTRGLVCNGVARDAGACVQPGAVGATCGVGAPCDALLRCFIAETDAGADAGDAAAPTTGACQAELVAPGGSCAGVGMASLCSRAAGLDCTGTGTAKTCTVLGVAATAAECGTVDGGSIACSAAGDCVIDAGEKSGNCEAAIADGMPCSLDVANPCLPPAKCIADGTGAGTCTRLDPTVCH